MPRKKYVYNIEDEELNLCIVSFETSSLNRLAGYYIPEGLFEAAKENGIAQQVVGNVVFTISTEGVHKVRFVDSTRW